MLILSVHNHFISLGHETPGEQKKAIDFVVSVRDNVVQCGVMLPEISAFHLDAAIADSTHFL